MHPRLHRQTIPFPPIGKLRRIFTVLDLSRVTPPTRLEGRSDIYLSTLRSYIEALGGHLEIAAVFGDERLPMKVGPTK